MRGGLLGGIFVLTFLLCASIKGRRVLRSGYFFANRGPLNQVAFLRKTVPEAAKFKRNVEINQDTNQQTVTYTDVEDDRSAAVAIANAGDSNYAAQNPYSPMSYFNKGNTNSQATANAQAMGSSQAAENAQAIANAQASASNIGGGYSGYGGFGGYKGYGYGVQQSPYYYPASSSSSSAQAQAQALSNTRNNPLVVAPSLLNTPSSSLSSALAQASANINSMERNLYSNPYLRPKEAEDEENMSQALSSAGSSSPDLSSRSSVSTPASANYNSEESNISGNLYFKSGEEDNVSETERSAYAQAVANAQALSNTGSTYPGLRPPNFNYLLPTSSSAKAQANANSQEQGNLYNIPYFRSGEEDDENISEAERSANANANVQAISNAGNSRPRIRPSLYNIPSYSSSSALAQALAKSRLRGQKHNNYVYRKSGDEVISDQLSEAEKSAQDQTMTNVQATGSSKSIEEVEELARDDNPSSRFSAAVTQSYLNDNNPNSKSDEVENLGELDHERSAYSQAIAKAYSTGNVGNNGFRIKPSLYNQPSSSISTALAQALANSKIRGYGSLYSKSGIPDEAQTLKYERSVEAQEEEIDKKREAQKKHATSDLLQESESKTDNPTNSRSAEVESSVDSKSDADENSNSLTNIETLEKHANKQAADDDNLDSEESRSAGLFAYKPSTPGFISRVLPNTELIDPNAISGQNIVKCTKRDEVHAVWLLSANCLICICVQEFWGLRPACASCNTCLAPPTPPPPPPLPPLPPIPDTIVPIPPLPQPIPVPQVSCDPLPTGIPFENPLNPCQTCICKQTFNVFGQPDVSIQCEENVQCMIPDIKPLPVPEPPSPMPTTACDNYPLNVPFPSPFDECQICKCVLDAYALSPNLVCVRSPECDVIPTPQPLPPQPTPLPPLPFPIPDPEPFPIISPGTVDIEPMPWPPIIPRPKPKSPLPGPPPHETCQPYPPNAPFQHPWDDCQICECSEIYGPNVINIEVSCYTKPSCCSDLPGPDPLPLPGPTQDQICQFQSLNVDFPSPTDACKICNCQLFGTMILPVCRPSKEYGCNISPGPLPYGNVVYIEPKCQYREPYKTFVVECNLCYCQEVFQYVIAKCTRQSNCVLGTPGVSPLQISSETDALANAIANANTNLQFPNYLSPLNSYNNIGNQLSSAIADVQAQSSANSYLSGLYGLPLTSSGNINTNTISNAQSEGLYNIYPYGVGGGSQSTALAEAIAKAQSLGQSPYGISPYSIGDSLTSALAQAEASSDVTGGSLYGNYPISSGISGQSNAQVQADAIANTQSLGLSPYVTNPYLVGGGDANFQAQADAISGAQGGGLYNSYPYLSGSSGLTNAQAQADAMANTQSLGLSPYGTNPFLVGGGGASAQAQADAISNAQGGGLYNTYPYLSGGSALTNAQAQAEALANAQSLGSLPYGSYPYNTGDSASALAQAQANSIYGNQSPLNLYPYSLLGGSQSNAQAQADATAKSQAGLNPFINNQYPGSSESSAQAQANAISESQKYPNLYPLSTPNVNPLYGLSQGQTSSQALANAQAQSAGSASAQSLAQAAAQSGRPLIRSGLEAEDDTNTTEDSMDLYK